MSNRRHFQKARMLVEKKDKYIIEKLVMSNLLSWGNRFQLPGDSGISLYLIHNSNPEATWLSKCMCVCVCVCVCVCAVDRFPESQREIYRPCLKLDSQSTLYWDHPLAVDQVQICSLAQPRTNPCNSVSYICAEIQIIS